MQTLTEVQGMLAELEQKEGKEAVYAWVAEHGKELADDVRAEILFQYSTDAFIEETKNLDAITALADESLAVLDELETAKSTVETELKKQDVQERLDQNKG